MKRFLTISAKRCAAALTASLALVLSGCSAPGVRLNVALSPELKAVYGYYPSVEVDVAAMAPSEAERVTSYSVDEWFSPDNPMRAGVVRKTLKFSEDRAGLQTIDDDDPFWTEGKSRGAEAAAVLVNLPGHEDPKPGAPDPRRIVVPLEAEHWYQTKEGTVWLLVGPAGIVKLAEPSVDEARSHASAADAKPAENGNAQKPDEGPREAQDEN